ncbi:hypothetical protein, partial [Acetobacter fabarum]|uniref:hypothetical protein n=1 Tax=Acetobacter fabarum TaxID=483199 RepID=UPI0020A01C8C
DQQVCQGRRLSDRFFYDWPSNWESLPADLMAYFSGMSLTEAESLSGQMLVHWVGQANRIAERQRKEAKNGRNR